MAGKPLQFRFNTRAFDAGVRKALLQHPQQAMRAMRQVAMLLRIEAKKRCPKVKAIYRAVFGRMCSKMLE